MTPLVDVVMVILIFLMLAGSFTGSSRYLLSRNFLRINSDPRPNAPAAPEIVIRVDPAETGFVAQSRSPRIDPTSDPQALQATLDSIRQRMVSAGTPVDKLQIVIQPGRRVKYASVLKVYESAVAAKFTKVALAASSD